MQSLFHERTNLPTILVVDDLPNTLSLVSELLADRYRCRVTTSGAKALSIAKTTPVPDIILLDVAMPEMDGYEVCRRLKENEETADIPVIFLTTMDSDEDEARGFAAGGADYITKPVNKTVLTSRLDAHVSALRAHRLLTTKARSLEKKIEEQARQIATMQDVVIMSLASMAEVKSMNSGDHIRRIQNYAVSLAHCLRKNPAYADRLTDDVIELLYKATPLHDIGKIGVRDSVLFKPGRLSLDEFEEMKRHSFFGGQTLLDVELHLAVPPEFVTIAHEIALHHHERWDGTGYPLGLQGEEIPLSARIVALADTYDALTSARVYKPPYPSNDARHILLRERGRQFDPAVVDAFLLCENDFHTIATQFADVEDGSQRSRLFLRLVGVGES